MSYEGPSAPQIFIAIVVLGALGVFGYLQFLDTSLGASPEATAVYERLEMTPLPNRLAERGKVKTALTALYDEPCAKTAVFSLANELAKAEEKRGAAEALLGFSKHCDSRGEKYAAVDLLMGLEDYDAALSASTELIAAAPLVPQYYAARAQAQRAQDRDEPALADMASAVAVYRQVAKADAPAFSLLAKAYEQAGRPCQGLTALESYLAAERGRRARGALQRQMAALKESGGCAADYASGAMVIQKRRDGSAQTRIAVNGARGRFVVDLAAAFTVLNPSFAAKAGVPLDAAEPAAFRQGDAALSGRLATAKSFTAAEAGQEARAADVSVVVADKALAGDADGILGLSFLARFDIAEGERAYRLKQR